MTKIKPQFQNKKNKKITEGFCDLMHISEDEILEIKATWKNGSSFSINSVGTLAITSNKIPELYLNDEAMRVFK